MKVVILGGGVVGVSTAWYLAQGGAEVTVIERQSDVALETSFRERLPDLSGILDALGRARHSAQGHQMAVHAACAAAHSP